MKEIKFRVWEKNDCRFLKNFHVLFASNLNSVSVGEFYYTENASHGYGLENEKDVIIQQFTGLRDSAGTDIYEGDICKLAANGGIAMADFIGNERGQDYSFTYAFVIPGTCYRQDFSFEKPENIKILGNIFENPELLKNESL